jgi:hypothetical protein
MQKNSGGIKRRIKLFKVNNGGERIDGEELPWTEVEERYK